MKIAYILAAALVFTACSTAGNGNQAKSGNTASAGNASNTASSAKTTGKGIDPQKACSVFEKAGLKPGEYEWDDKYSLSSCSISKYIGPSGRQRALRLFASGDRALVDHLELSLETILDDSDIDFMKGNAKKIESDLRTAVLDAMAAGGDDLANLTAGKPLPSEAKNAIKSMTPGKWTLGDVSVELEKDDKPGMGFDLNLHFRY
ncbi:MAG: hypothetical protein ABL999_09405 [Pyrinomonadaceae bacterium]